MPSKKGKGIIIILSAADVGEECVSDLSVFANTTKEVQTLFHNCGLDCVDGFCFTLNDMVVLYYWPKL